MKTTYIPRFITVITSLILLFACMLSSCKNDDEDQLYELGLILLGFKSDVDIQKAFEIVNDNALTIKRMQNFIYTTQYSIDSINYISANLNTKNYLALGSNSIRIEDNEIRISSIFREMSLENQEDWLNTITFLQLIDLNIEGKGASVIVPVGAEELWVKYFEPNPMLSWATLNYYISLN